MDNTTIGRPLPRLDDTNQFFWTSGAKGVLQFLRCDNCKQYIHPPSPTCPKCLSVDLTPHEVSGSASLETFTVNYQPWAPDMPVPYIIAIISIDEQPSVRLTTNIINSTANDLYIGQKVRVTFKEREGVWLPLFEPIK